MGIKEKILNAINTYAGEDINLCYYILGQIRDAEEPYIGLMEFFEQVSLRSSDHSMILDKFYSAEELEKLNLVYSNYTNSFLDTLVKKAHIENWNKEKFYQCLWERINEDYFLENDKKRAFAILKCAQSNLLPYVEIGTPLTMDNDKFIKILNRNIDSVKKIRHIIGLGFSQKTEIASLILEELLSIPKTEDQVVILAMALETVTQNSMNNIAAMLKRFGIDEGQK